MTNAQFRKFSLKIATVITVLGSICAGLYLVTREPGWAINALLVVFSVLILLVTVRND